MKQTGLTLDVTQENTVNFALQKVGTSQQAGNAVTGEAPFGQHNDGSSTGGLVNDVRNWRTCRSMAEN